jgi:hypothetical protein
VSRRIEFDGCIGRAFAAGFLLFALFEVGASPDRPVVDDQGKEVESVVMPGQVVAGLRR